MAELDTMGIHSEPLFQAKKYRAKEYNVAIKNTLQKAPIIRDILNRYRSEPLGESWLPISLYCENCGRDRIKSMSFDGKNSISYECSLCEHQSVE